MFAIFLIVNVSKSQSIEIGNPLPNWKLHNIQNFSQGSITMDELKGKWTILDFWSPRCATCIKSIPNLKEISTHFSNDLQILLVTKDTGEDVRRSYKKFSEKYEALLPIAYDTEFFNRFNIPWVPYYVLIDPHGIAKTILHDVNLTKATIKDLMEGKELEAREKLKLEDFNWLEPLLVNGNGGEETDFMYRSLLMKWNHGIPATGVTHISTAYGNMIQSLGSPLRNLYFLAYQDTIHPYPNEYRPDLHSSYGKYWLRPILELSDSSEFEWDEPTEKNLFCYSLIVPKNKLNSLQLQKIMQRDLKNYFGYEVTVEKRKMPSWNLVATEKARKQLITAGGTPKYTSYDFAGFEFENIPIKEIIAKLWANFQLEPLFVDKTGITGNIDISIDANLTDFQDFKSALNKYGLDLIRGTTQVKVIVIHNKNVF